VNVTIVDEVVFLGNSTIEAIADGELILYFLLLYPSTVDVSVTYTISDAIGFLNTSYVTFPEGVQSVTVESRLPPNNQTSTLSYTIVIENALNSTLSNAEEFPSQASITQLPPIIPPTIAPTNSPNGTNGTTPTPTPAPSNETTPTPTPMPSNYTVPTELPTPTPTPTESPSPTPTPSNDTTPTESPTPTPTESPTESPTPTPTESPTELPTPEPTYLPINTPMPTVVPSPSPSPINVTLDADTSNDHKRNVIIGSVIGGFFGLVLLVVAVVLVANLVQKQNGKQTIGLETFGIKRS